MADDPLVAGASAAFGMMSPSHEKPRTWSAAAGSADLEKDVALTPRHVIPMGSVSKLLTVAALATMVDDGLLTFETKASDLLDDLPDQHAETTLGDLAGHLSGIRHYVASDRFLGPEVARQEAHVRHYETIEAVLDIFIDDGLVAPPGVAHHYSSYAYALLSRAMEAAAGKPFLDIVEERVLAPLGLTATRHNDVYALIAGRAEGYEAEDGELYRAPAHDPSYVWAGGGYIGTAEDLVRFALAHVDPGFIEGETLDQMLQPRRLQEGGLGRHGIGWELSYEDLREGYAGDPSASGFRDDFLQLLDGMDGIVFHAGSTVGGHGFLAFAPATGAAAAYLSNSNGPGVDAAAVRITYDILRLVDAADRMRKACRDQEGAPR